VIVAHPDDEVIGLGAQLPRLQNALFVQVTNGGPLNGRDAREHGFRSVADYVAARQREWQLALSTAGLDNVRKFELACPDQEAAYRLASLSRSIRDILRETRPEVVVTHPYEGGHPDHDATAFAVHAACALLGQSAPPLIEAASYHGSTSGIETGCFLPAEGVQAVTIQLTPEQRELKQRLMSCFATQRQVLDQFRTDVECFRPAPRYDFSEPPHPGPLFYERFDWGLSAARFRELATAALDELELTGSS
jgi:LmbE family N-acetylglucosaminyl deacetylase